MHEFVSMLFCLFVMGLGEFALGLLFVVMRDAQLEALGGLVFVIGSFGLFLFCWVWLLDRLANG